MRSDPKRHSPSSGRWKGSSTDPGRSDGRWYAFRRPRVSRADALPALGVARQMVKLQRRPFGEPDDVRQIPYGHLETYDMGEIRIGRSVLNPGWRWSESIKPIAQT